MKENEFIGLLELQNIIQERIGEIQQWVKVELESCTLKGRHCYLDFVERGVDGGIVARAKGMIWGSRKFIIDEFEDVTGKNLEKGLSIVVLASVTYHPVYGLALTISDIDPSFTLGQVELERRATIARLEKDGCMEMQKELCLPFLPRHIAIVSSDTAAGYGDFINHLAENPRGYSFNCTLFQSVMQGDNAPFSIISSLQAICEAGDFDLILIFRGGGSQADLFCFDDYNLARAIAECPVPVMTAIGHERDYHIADMVAHDYYKTPTAMADRLIEWYDSIEDKLEDALESLQRAILDRLDAMDKEVSRCTSTIRMAAVSAVDRLENELSLAQTRINAADPRTILRQGYVLAVGPDGKMLKNVDSASAGDEFILRFRDGRWKCGVKETIKNEI